MTQLHHATRNADDTGTLADPFNGMNVRRAAQEGARDVGDVHAVPFILECKDVRSPAVPTWLRQADAEAGHAGFPYGVVVHKRRGSATGSNACANWPRPSPAKKALWVSGSRSWN